MASVLAEPTLITGEALLTMSNSGPCELVEGRIVPMTPPGNDHGIVQALLIWYLQTFVIPRKLGWVTGGEAGVYTHRNPDSVRGMDVAFISYVRQPARPRGYLRAAPELDFVQKIIGIYSTAIPHWGYALRINRQGQKRLMSANK